MNGVVNDMAYEQDLRAMRLASNPRAVQTIRRAMKALGKWDARAERVADDALARLMPSDGPDGEGYCWTCGNDFVICEHGPGSNVPSRD